MESWKYYNHALIPTTDPYKDADVKAFLNCDFWRKNKKALFARWTSDFDCGYETDWWYLIKDKAFDVNESNAKRRYEITKGLKKNDVRRISFDEYAEQIHEVLEKAVTRYAGVGSTSVTADDIRAQQNDGCRECYAAFIKDTDDMIGYATIIKHGEWIDLAELKLDPEYMRLNAAAAIVYTLLSEYVPGKDIRFWCDGERCIRHKTNFQEYLMKYFGFRRAYCMLNLYYRPSVRIAVTALFPLRNIIGKLSKNSMCNNIYSILFMEEIVRKQRKRNDE